MVVDVIIPVLNEEKSIAKVLAEIPSELVRYVIVCDNGSTDQTARVASDAGAVVVSEPRRGYGNACLKGMEWIAGQSAAPDAVAFLDGDYSDYPEELSMLLEGIEHGGADLVLGARTLGDREKGSLTPQQVFGNWLATALIKLFYGIRFYDLGPFRVVRYGALLQMKMKDRNYGWTVEMQAKAAKMGLRTLEFPVRYRKRVGTSKVSGTIKGSVLAGIKILWTIFTLRIS